MYNIRERLRHIFFLLFQGSTLLLLVLKPKKNPTCISILMKPLTQQILKNLSKRTSHYKIELAKVLQLNKYETASYFIQFSQKLTYDCLLISGFPSNLSELNLKLFWTSEQNNFRFSSGKFGGKHRNQQTITCQVLAELNKIWSCLIFIKLYSKAIQIYPK